MKRHEWEKSDKIRSSAEIYKDLDESSSSISDLLGRIKNTEARDRDQGYRADGSDPSRVRNNDG